MNKLVVILLIFSYACRSGSKITVLETTRTVDFSEMKIIQKYIDYRYRIKFEIKNDSIISYWVSKNDTLYRFNDKTGNKKLLDLKSLNITSNNISIINDRLYFYSDNSIKLINLRTKKDSILYTKILTDSTFLINSMYNQNDIFPINKSIYLQIGNSNNKLNFVDTFIFTKLSNEINKIVQYPTEFNRSYQHYNEANFIINDTVIYYSFPTINKIFSYNVGNKSYKYSKITNGDYMEFDTSKYTDVLYINDFSKNTAYNINMYLVGKYPVILQRFNTNEHNLLIFDENLNFLRTISIRHPVSYFYVYSISNYLYFAIPSENKLVKYEFN